jgi:hypothetical protein
MKNYYKLCCRILKYVIREAKYQYYNKQIFHSNNKMKTIWDITKSRTGKSTKNYTMFELYSNGNENNSSKDITDSFSLYLIPIMENNFNNTSLKLIITVLYAARFSFFLPKYKISCCYLYRNCQNY